MSDIKSQLPLHSSESTGARMSCSSMKYIKHLQILKPLVNDLPSLTAIKSRTPIITASSDDHYGKKMYYTLLCVLVCGQHTLSMIYIQRIWSWNSCGSSGHENQRACSIPAWATTLFCHWAPLVTISVGYLTLGEYAGHKPTHTIIFKSSRLPNKTTSMYYYTVQGVPKG